MDVIDKEVIKRQHIWRTAGFPQQTWDRLWKEVLGKKLFLFGAGTAMDFFLIKKPKEIVVDGVIDNSSAKQGLSIRELSSEAWEKFDRDIVISNKSILNNYAPEEVVIVICSLNYYEDIAVELKQMGFSNLYSLRLIEAVEKAERKNAEYKQFSLDETYEYMYQKYGKEPLQKKIVFRAFGDYADHEKYITEALLRTDEKVDLVWLVSNLRADVPKGVRVVWNGNYKKVFYELLTAKMWIADVPMHECARKRPGQIYVQTKHWASVTLKRFYLDTVAFHNEPQKRALWEKESVMIDHIVVGSEFDKESCRRGFAFEGEFWETGSPRTDAMFCEKENREKICRTYGINESSRLLLYAPTYRFSIVKGNSVHESKNIGMDYEKIKMALTKRFGGEWVILLRLHPSVKDAYKDIAGYDFVIDASMHADSQELVSAADVTISDYSSIMFEPAFVGKKVFLFATDKEDYIDKEYDLLIDYNELPFPVAESNEELEQVIENFDEKVYSKKLNEFLTRYGVKEDGHAAERTAKLVLDALKK